MWFISLFSMVSCNFILVPKEHQVYSFNFGAFNSEHNIEHLASVDNLTIYKTDSASYLKYKSTLEHLFDIEEEQVYNVPQLIERTRDNLVFVQEPGQSVFKPLEPVPWHLDRISKRHLPLNGTYAYSEKGSCHRNPDVDIETVVVDTGCDTQHPEFEGRAEFLENFTDDNIDNDANSHGTFCSSQIGGLTAGVCKDAKIYCVKVLDSRGSGSTSGVIAGMEYTFKRHLERSKENPKLRTVMSMSLGGGKSLAMNRAVEKMVKSSNTFYITVASGNENSNACNTSPASARGIFTVNAMDQYDDRAYFSNYGTCTDIYSPGVDNYGAVLNGKYAVESGTSFSTPILAGILNHYLDMYPHMNLAEIKHKLLEDATKDTIEGNPKNTPNLMVYLERN